MSDPGVNMEIVWNVSHEIPRSLDGILQKLHVFVMFFPCGMKILWNILHRFPAIIKLGPICRETPRNISHEMPWSPHGVFMFFLSTWHENPIQYLESRGVFTENFTRFSPRNSMGNKTGTAILQDRQFMINSAFNSIFGKVGRTASEEVVLHLVIYKSMLILLYRFEVLNLNKSQLNSILWQTDLWWNSLILTICKL